MYTPALSVLWEWQDDISQKREQTDKLEVVFAQYFVGFALQL